MEHPLRVDEFFPSEAPPVLGAEPRAAEPAPAAVPSTPLPALPNLPASEVLFLKPGERISVNTKPAEAKTSSSAADNSVRRD